MAMIGDACRAAWLRQVIRNRKAVLPEEIAKTEREVSCPRCIERIQLLIAVLSADLSESQRYLTGSCLL